MIPTIAEDRKKGEGIERLRPYLELYGEHELSYSTLQDGLEYFLKDGTGYIAFKRMGSSVLALSDPVAPTTEHERITAMFLEEFKNVSFWQTHRNYAKLLNQKFGYYANQMGVTTEMMFGEYTLEGTAKQCVRTAMKKAESEGVSIKESSIGSTSGLDELVDEYISNKTVQDELSFLARKLPREDEWAARVFTATKNDETLGIGVFNPLFKDGRTIGYVSDILRTRPDSPKGLAHAINMAAYQKFDDERRMHEKETSQKGKRNTRNLPKLQRFSLGFSPYAHIHDDGYINNPLTTLVFVAAYQFGNSLYNSKGLAENKRAYDGVEIPVYACSRKKLIVGELLKCYGACGISISRQVLRRK